MEAPVTCVRPWGTWEVIEEGNRFKVKRLTVTPGQSISLQKHMHRSEHWVVVEGTAIVFDGSDAKVVTENESTYIPLGGIHRLISLMNNDLGQI